MKFICTIICLLTIFNFFAQDLQLEKIEQTKVKLKKVKEKISYPIELEFGYGTLLSLNNDSVETSNYFPDLDTTVKYTYPMLSFDTINKFNNYSSYNFGARKRYGRFNFGINLQYSYLNNNFENPFKDWYSTDINGVSYITKDYEQSELLQKANLLIVNLTTDYIFLETQKIQLAFGFNVGGLNFRNEGRSTESSVVYNYSYQVSGTSYILTLDSTHNYTRDYSSKNQTFSLNMSPSFSVGYKVSNSIKAELTAFYIFQLNSDISHFATNNYTINGNQFSSIPPSMDVNIKSSYQNPSKLGVNLNLVIGLGKVKQ